MKKYTDIEEMVRLIAFYLPQYHPIPENDLWWGKGFTEWTNVTKAKPLFEGHYQPHLPTDLGFYDLRLRETRHEQIALARQYGIDGFCYHYYWFSGKRILNKPLDDMLIDPQSNMPFCLCWANENWTRCWDGADNDVLLAQEYFDDDPAKFIKSIASYLKDPRYICINGAPVLIVYMPQAMPEPQKIVSLWRKACDEIGIDKIHLCAALTHGNEDYSSYGFDSGVEFPPHNLHTSLVNHKLKYYENFEGYVYNYPDVGRSYLNKSYGNGKKVFRTVYPSWDNTARKGNNAVITINSTPSNYEYWLASTISNAKKNHTINERLVFINAWNEWAEGCHLEPDRVYKRGFLEATLRAKENQSILESFSETKIENAIAELPQKNNSFWMDLKWLLKGHSLRLFYFVYINAKNFLGYFPRTKKFLKRILGR